MRDIQPFTYTAKRSAYLSIVITLFCLMLLEGSVITFIATLFISNGWFKLLPVGIIFILLLYISYNLLSPVFTKHYLTETDLHLRYGKTLNIRIPRGTILTAQPIRENLTVMQPLQAQYDAKKLRLITLPVLFLGVLIDLFLSWRLSLPAGNIVPVILAIALIILTCLTLPVLGSIWDENLTMMVEGAAQILMQEEMTITPKRMLLFNGSILLFVLSMLAFWTLPLLLALAIMVVLACVVCYTIWLFSSSQMARLLR